MEKLTVEVSQDLVNYIERLDYEATSYKDVIMTLLDMHKGDPDGSAIDNPVFKSYQEKFSQVKAEYDLAKNQVTEQYIPGCLQEHEVDWTLNYSSCELTINVKCKCGQEILEQYVKEMKEKSED